MKIKSVNIASFGGLKNLFLNFSDGFNVIYGNNENGKTTVMSFIKMMFYGNERGSAAISKSPRKKYTPWDGSAMAGSIDFEHSGKSYRLEREFRSSNSTDKLSLIDLDLGTRQSVSGDIGTKFFGLSSAAFERSVFIGQFGYSDKDSSAEGEINSKLSNIVSTGDESISYEAVSKRLEKAKLTLMSKSGRAGEYDKNMRLIAETENELQKSEEQQKHYQNLKIQIDALKTEIAEMEKSADSLKQDINSEQDVKNANKLKELLALKEKLDMLNSTLVLSDGKLADEVFVRKVLFCISKTEAIKQKIAAKAEEAESLTKSIELAVNPSEEISPEKAEQLKIEIESLENDKLVVAEESAKLNAQISRATRQHEEILKSRKPVNIPVLIAGIIVLLIGIALFATGNALFGSVLTVISVAVMVMSYFLRPKNTKKIQESIALLERMKNRQNEIGSDTAEISQKISYLSAKLETINSALNSSTALIEHQKKLLLECNDFITAQKAELKKETTDLLELFSRYKKADNIEEIKQQLDFISLKAAEQKEIKQQLTYVLRDVGNISYDEARKKLEEIGVSEKNSTTDFGGIKQKYENTLTGITEKKTALATLCANAKTCISGCDTPDNIKAKLKTLKETTAKQKEFCDTADIAMEVLAESFAELRRSYGSVLEQKSSEIFKGITAGQYENMTVSKSFDINVEKSGVFGGKELDYLSSGTADQAYLSLRLALSELISDTAEPLPVMLDDALTQYDDDRIKQALDFLKKYSEKEQIIMFTCHNSIFQASKQIGADCSSL